jgi:hypothetical protein
VPVRGPQNEAGYQPRRLYSCEVPNKELIYAGVNIYGIYIKLNAGLMFILGINLNSK